MNRIKSRVSRRRFLHLAGAAAGATILASGRPTPAPAAPAPAPKALIKVWMENMFLPEMDKWNEATLKEWAAKNNAEIEFTASSGVVFRQRLAAAAGTDAIPNIAAMFASIHAQWRGRKQLVPMTDVVNRLNKKAGGFMPSALSIVFADGEYWGVPQALDTIVMHARQDLLDKIGAKYPATWDEFRTVCKEIQKANPGIYAWAQPLGNDADCENSFLPILWGFGGSFCNKDGTLAIKSDAMLQAIELVRKMYKEDKIIPPDAVTWDGTGNNKAYQSKQCAFAYNSTSIYAWATQNDPELMRATKLYPPPAGPVGSFSTLSGFGLAVFAGTKNIELAKLAVEYYMEPNRFAQLEKLGKGRFVTPYRDLLFSDFWLKSAYESIPRIVETGRLYSYPAPFVSAVADMMETYVISEMLQKILVNNVDPKKALEEAYEKARPIWVKYGLG